MNSVLNMNTRDLQNEYMIDFIQPSELSHIKRKSNSRIGMSNLKDEKYIENHTKLGELIVIVVNQHGTKNVFDISLDEEEPIEISDDSLKEKLEEKKLTSKDIRMVKKIGDGASGSVFLAISPSKRHYAIKILHDTAYEHSTYKTMISIWKSLNHPFFIKL